MASRRKVMVGVNNYPDINETLAGDEWPVPADAWRAAAVFEQIRLRSDRWSRSGRRLFRLRERPLLRAPFSSLTVIRWSARLRSSP
jgi:methylmalonyl-CoA mutase N-terminal domain/subunit